MFENMMMEDGSPPSGATYTNYYATPIAT